ncbi:hypothetical protein HMI55_005612 [Coelomomyces lativittatus]|nr:hypothetical protein HMI55_005612 [Coelomomyces lativittatus]
MKFKHKHTHRKETWGHMPWSLFWAIDPGEPHVPSQSPLPPFSMAWQGLRPSKGVFHGFQFLGRVFVWPLL